MESAHAKNATLYQEKDHNHKAIEETQAAADCLPSLSSRFKA